MTVVDYGARRQSSDRFAGRGGTHWVAAKDSPCRAEPEQTSLEHNGIQGLGIISDADRPGPGAIVSGSVVPHPATGYDVVAFLVVEDSEALALLRDAKRVQFSFERDIPWGLVAGPVELVRADQVQADWFRWMVGEVFTAAGGTIEDLAVHEQTIGIPATVVAFLRPERIEHARIADHATAPRSSSVPQRQRRPAARRIPVPNGGAA